MEHLKDKNSDEVLQTILEFDITQEDRFYGIPIHLIQKTLASKYNLASGIEIEEPEAFGFLKELREMDLIEFNDPIAKNHKLTAKAISFLRLGGFKHLRWKEEKDENEKVSREIQERFMRSTIDEANKSTIKLNERTVTFYESQTRWSRLIVRLSAISALSALAGLCIGLLQHYDDDNTSRLQQCIQQSSNTNLLLIHERNEIQDSLTILHAKLDSLTASKK